MPNWTRGQLKNNAKMNFYKNYWMCVGMALILTLVLMMEPDGPKKEIMLKIRDYTDILPAYGYQGWLSSLFDGLGYWFGVLWSVFSLFIALVLLLIKIVVGNVVYVGGIRFFIQNRRENPSAGTIFFGFQNGNYGNIALTIFLKDLYTALWTLLLVVPGIIKHYEYRMIPYILAENPTMPREEAFQISRRMMMGQKMDVFVLDLSFIGWFILEKISFGLAGLFFVRPYYETVFAELYEANKQKAYRKDISGNMKRGCIRTFILCSLRKGKIYLKLGNVKNKYLGEVQ